MAGRLGAPGVMPDPLEDAVARAFVIPPGDTRPARVLAAGTARGEAPGLVDLIAALALPPPPDRGARMRDARIRARAALVRARRSGLGVVPWGDGRYPEALGHIPDPPIVIWVRGDARAMAGPAVAIVGSRYATPAGAAVARRLARDLAAAGLTIVSGLAKGIDAAAHEGALDAGGVTVAVLGCGADVVYPAGHASLAARVAEAGAVVSELEPGLPPRAYHFPLRNRIISGLSRAVVVVEASERSGSLITARMALEQGRDVLAVPGNVLSGRSRGCHALIKDGARLVETVEDVFDEIGLGRPAPAPAGPAAAGWQASPLEETMAAGEPYTADDLARRTGRPVGDLLAELASLEVAGRIRRVPGGGFVRT